MKTELMKIVERAVRPVVAYGQTKMKMREELLAHLTGIYEEERAAGRDESGALARAAERFGPVEATTEKLRQSVHPKEIRGQRHGESWLRRPGETMPGYAMRVSGLLLIWTAPMIVFLWAAVPVIKWLEGKPIGSINITIMALMSVLYVVGSPLAGAVFVCLWDLLWRACRTRLLYYGLGLFLMGCLFSMAGSVAFFGWVIGNAMPVFENVDVFVVPWFVLPMLFAIAMVGIEFSRRNEDLWTELAI